MGLFSGIKKNLGSIGGIVGGAFGGPTGAAIGSSIGGLLGGRGGQTTTTSMDLKALRDNAIKAGFNPLTVLNATGGQAVVQSTVPPMSSRQFLANALGDSVDTYFNRVDADRDYQLETAKLGILQQEMQERQAQKTRPTYGQDLGFSIPNWNNEIHNSGTMSEVTGPALARPANALGYGALGKPDTSPNMVMGPAGIENATPDAPDFEQNLNQWAENGTIRKNIQLMWNRNFMGGHTPREVSGSINNWIREPSISWLRHPPKLVRTGRGGTWP
ncbi:hypothetical protein [Tortoise microvirus 37]|nr:hypothetical protein [Tortoise microvirus 37]